MEWLAFFVGTIIGGYIVAELKTRQARKLLQKRGDALRAITKHKWDTGLQNDAVTITKIAMKGLEYD